MSLIKTGYLIVERIQLGGGMNKGKKSLFKSTNE